MDFDNSLDAITPDIASLTITIGGTGSILIPSGSTAQRPPSGLAAGMLRWSTDTVSGGITGAVEVYTGVTNSWKQVQYQSTNLDGLSGLSTTGILARTGSGTFTPRSIAVTTSRLQISNADGVSGNPTIDFASSVTLAGVINWSPYYSMATSATVDLGTSTSNTVIISGTSTITSFGSTAPAGSRRWVGFSGVLLLTHNATSLILPGAANITTAVNDSAEFLCLSTGNWICTVYTRANGTAIVGGTFTGGTLTSALNEAPPVTLASAGTVNIGAAAANSIIITGTVSITAFDSVAAGIVRHLTFSTGYIGLVHSSALILPSNQVIIALPGDTATFESRGSGNWTCTNFKRANGRYIVPNPDGTGYVVIDSGNSLYIDEDIFANRPISGVLNGSYNPSNLLQNLYPQDFASWTPSNTTVTVNSGVAPDGTTTAALVVPNTTASVAHNILSLSSSTTYSTVIWYAKANGYNYIGVSDDPDNWVYFTLSGKGSVSIGTGWVDATITPLDNGWYRCTAATTSTMGGVYLFVLASLLADGNTSPSTAATPNGTSGAYFWQVQIVNGYDPILGRLFYATDQKILYKDNCRGSTSGWEVIRPSPATNSISAQSTEAIAANQLVYVLGENNVVQSSNFGTTWSFTNVTQTVSFTAQGVFSVYAKAAEYSWISFGSGIAAQYVHFNLATGAVSSLGTGWTAATITALSNGWYRCTATSTASTAWTNVKIYVNNSMPASGATSPISFIGVATSGVYLWGASLTTGTTVQDYQRTTTAVAVAGTVGLADATTEGKYATGFSKYTVLSGEYGTFLLAGNILTGSSGLLPGNSYYLTTTPGNIVVSSAAPSTTGSGQVFQKIGVALTSTSFMFNPESPFTL
jgi:hypothetical protein